MKSLQSEEWAYVVSTLLSLQINAKDAKAFVELIAKLEHQHELSIKREIKNSNGG